jgi:PAS domain S-box-containing protein
MKKDAGHTRTQLTAGGESLRESPTARKSPQLDRTTTALGEGEEFACPLVKDAECLYRESPIGLCHFDTNLRYVHINEWLAALNGLSMDRHVGRTIGEVLPDVAAGVESQLRRVIESGEPILEGIVVAETAAHPGVKRHYQHNYYPIRSDDGTVVGVSCAVQDVTRRRLAEQALQEANDALERRVRERTEELEEINASLKREIAERTRAEQELLQVRKRVVRAQDEERRRIARELHDDVTQRLAALAMTVGGLERNTPQSTVPILDKLRDMRRGIEQLSADVHGLSRKLHSSALEDLGLVQAIRSECERLEEHGEFEIEFSHDNLLDAIPPESSLPLFRIAQEALRNVQKHARTRQVQINLTEVDGHLRLSVEDHGAGFQQPEVKGSGGIGLVTMEERARLSGGRFSIRSSPGKGTTVEVSIPWRVGAGDRGGLPREGRLR